MKNMDLVESKDRLIFTKQSHKQKSDRYFLIFMGFAAVYFLVQFVRPAFIA